MREVHGPLRWQQGEMQLHPNKDDEFSPHVDKAQEDTFLLFQHFAQLLKLVVGECCVL